MPQLNRTNESHSNLIKFPVPTVPTELINNPAELTHATPIYDQLKADAEVLDRLSKYPCKFDYGIYKALELRYADNPPNGGVLFKTSFKLVNHHSSCSKCHYAFEIDSYGRGCIHDCVYCYAKESLTKRGYWNRPIPFPVDVNQIRSTFHAVFETDRPNKWREVLESRVPLRIGSMSDSFMWMDKKYGVTKELLRILKFYKYPYIVFTKSDLVASDEYVDLLDKDLAAIQFSISGGNEELTRLIEPGAPSVKRRLNALKHLHKCGFWTTVRINPLFPIYPDGYFTDPDLITKRFGSKANVPRFDLFNLEFIDQLAANEVPSILVGFARLTQVAVKHLGDVTGVPFKEFFTPNLYAQPGPKRYSDREIAAYYWQIAQRCKSNGVRFNTCYIGNGIKDYYQYQDLWTNASKDCCDVRGNLPSFRTSSQEIPWASRAKFAPCKTELKKSKDSETKWEKGLMLE